MHNSHLLDGWHAPPSVLNRLPVDATVFVSSFLRDEAKRIQPKYDDAFVLYNGADQSIFHPDDAPRQTYGPTTVLYVGRLIPEKGPHLFFEAMRQLHQEGLNVRGIIIGASALPGEREGSYAQSLRKNIPPNVVFHPYCVGNKLGDVFRNADIFCHPAQWEEPFGMVIVEAMASGLPVVATRCGGIPEILKNGGGVLVNRDSIEELVSTLKELVRNNSLRKMLGQEARSSFLKSFPWSVAKQSYQAIARGLSDASK